MLAIKLICSESGLFTSCTNNTSKYSDVFTCTVPELQYFYFMVERSTDIFNSTCFVTVHVLYLIFVKDKIQYKI